MSKASFVSLLVWELRLAKGFPLLTWGRGKIRNNLQRILHHWHILYHVLIHIQNEFKLYPYIWLSKGDLGDFLNLAHFSSQTVLLGWNERNSHKHSCFNFIFSQASGTCKLQQLCLWEFLSFRPCNTAAMAQKFECGEAFTVSEWSSEQAWI